MFISVSEVALDVLELERWFLCMVILDGVSGWTAQGVNKEEAV